MTHLIRILALLMIVVPAKADMKMIDSFAIDQTEVSIAQFQRFAEVTGFVSQAERSGGGEVPPEPLQSLVKRKINV